MRDYKDIHEDLETSWQDVFGEGFKLRTIEEITDKLVDEGFGNYEWHNGDIEFLIQIIKKYEEHEIGDLRK